MRRPVARFVFLGMLFTCLFLGMFPVSAFAQVTSVHKTGPVPIQINGQTWIHDDSVSTQPLHSTNHSINHTSTVAPSYTTAWKQSNNWAGWYEGDGAMTFNFVQGEWNIPCADGPYNSQHQLVDWVGLGGVADNGNLLQAGTWLRSDGQWHIFFELVGSSNQKWSRANFSTDSYQCGDHMYVAVDYDYLRTGSNKNHIYIQDLTDHSKNQFDFTVPDNFVPNLKSADWIDERPACFDISRNIHFTNLPNFHHVTWFNNGANRIGYGAVDMGTFQNTHLDMVAAGEVLADEPSGPSNTSFTDVWNHSGLDGYPCGI